MSRVLITGIGVISAIGNSAAANRQALLSGQCGISKNTHLSSRYSGVLPFGEIALTNEYLQKQLQITDPGVTRTTLLAIHACNEAIADAKLSAEELISTDTALINATTVGGMCLMDQLYIDANSSKQLSAYAASYDCSSVASYLQKQYGVGGIINTINTACSSSANAILYGARLITNGLAKRAIVGGVDSLSKFTINGFNALHILSDEYCRPFDENRKGLNLGEGAAFLVLEKEEEVKQKEKYAAVTGYYNSTDAFHPSSLSENGEGPFLAMQGALLNAGLSEGDISFINAHGTGTENNDAAESIAMLRVFKQLPPFASTKSNTGHTLGASGAIEAVYSILNIMHQEVYPALQFQTPIASTKLEPVARYTKARLQHIMSNSFGFGGNCTSLIFSQV